MFKSIFFGLLLSASMLSAQTESIKLGVLDSGASVSFVQGDNGEWGIDIAGGPAPRIAQSQPVRLEIHADTEILPLRSGYRSVEKTPEGITASARVDYQDALFQVTDHWQVKEKVLSLRRDVKVEGSAPGGFQSSIVFSIDPSVGWFDIDCMAPGALYGDPTHDGERSPGGTLNHAARRFLMREDIISAPLFALSFPNGTSVAVLDTAPQGDTTVAESQLAETIMTDARFKFGSLGAWQEDEKPVEFGFQYPGAMTQFSRGPTGQTWYRRYHPIQEDTVHAYAVGFRFGRDESFRDVTRNSWRWAWETLKPKVEPIDVEQMRRVLTDQLASLANTIDGRTAVPFAVNTISDERQWNDTVVAIGFVGKGRLFCR